MLTPKQEAAMRDALNALLRVQPQVRGAIPQQDVEDAIDTLRAALAEPVQEPQSKSFDERLRRGITGQCSRSKCECEEQGLGDQCIWLQPAEPVQGPVAWMKTDGAITTDAYQAACWRDSHTVTPLYTAPPQRHVKAPCRYPDCVDNGPDGKCTRWLLSDCDGGSNA